MTSERNDPTGAPGDDGVTMIELLVGIILMGMLTWAISTALVVVLRQGDNTAGRLNNARSEQAVDTWMPTDLASASTVNIDAGASPCGTVCPPTANVTGSNALMLSWDSVTDDGGSGTVTTSTNVSYRYVQVGEEWQLIRVECVRVGSGNPACSSHAVVHNLDGPPPNQPWEPGTTVPSWVIEVAVPLNPADPGNTGTTLPADPNAKTKGAQRVIVTINGGGDSAGAGGGINQISLSAGGTTRATIPANSTSGVPSFTAARTRCGGNVVLIVDESGSIGSTNIDKVKTAVRGFIDVFSGTPVRLEIVRFDNRSSVLEGTNSGLWSRYFDMLVPAQVTELRNAVSSLSSKSSTNWEEAFYRTFKNQDGTQNQIVPDLVVFFTDGVPTVSRAYGSSYRAGTGPVDGTGAPAYPPPPAVGYPAADGSKYNQVGFDRADLLIRPYRGTQTRVIGVGVGSAIDSDSDTSDFITPATGWHWFYEIKKSNKWVAATSTEYNNASSQNRRRTQAFSPPYDFGTATSNRTILSRIVKGTDNAERALPGYSNSKTADVYFESNWDGLTTALAQIALEECGGTLTLQTRTNTGPAPDPFSYQNTAIRSSTGALVDSKKTVVTTTGAAKSGTFDFEFSSGQYVTVDIMPQNTSDLTAWEHAGWSCTSGPNDRPVTVLDDPESDWVGFQVQVRANEAVSCVQTVTR